MQSLRLHLKPYRRPLILGPFFKLLEAIFELILPLVMARMIDLGVRAEDPIVLRNSALTMFALVLAGMLTSFACQYMASLASQGFGTDLRKAVFAKTARLTPAALQAFGSASITNRATFDINQLQLTTAMSIRLLTRAPFLSIFGVVMAWRISPVGGAILLFAVIPAGLVIYLIYRFSLPYFVRARRGIDKVSRLIMDLLSGVRVIRAFNRQSHEERYFAEANERMERDMRRAQRISGLMSPLTTLILNAAIFFLLFSGGKGIRAAAALSVTEGELLALINYANSVLMALTVAANMFNLLTRAKSSADRIVEILDSDEVEDPGTGEAPAPVAGAPLLEVRGLDFHYAGNENLVLEDVRFTLYSGQTLGILGPTGAGKTTLLDLLFRHYEPTAGEILLQGRPAADWPLGAWRSLFSIAPQKAVLFSGTVRDNLRWGLCAREDGGPTERDDEERILWEALELAAAADFIRALPRGTEAPVLRAGRNFSGGQRQRLSLARAFLKEAPILVQDDSTSALDFATDAAVRRALRERRPQLTRIIVSQRVHTIMDADRILLLDSGKVIAQGDHESLLRCSELYREICAYQLEEAAVGAGAASETPKGAEA